MSAFRVFRRFLEKGFRRRANPVLHDRLAKLQCRGEKFRRVRKLGVHEINKPATCFCHDGLIDGIQRVQTAIRVVFREIPHVNWD